jgi:hypothetical protein
VIIKPDVFQHVALDTDDGRTDVYPASLMGFIAVVRQSFFDAQHYALDQADYLKHPGARQRPEYNKSDEALALAIEHKMPVVFEPKDALMVDRSARIAGAVHRAAEFSRTAETAGGRRLGTGHAG